VALLEKQIDLCSDIEMWPIVIIHLGFISQAASVVDIKTYWQNVGLSLNQVPWISVTNRASLETGLRCNNCMLSLKVQNGTEWLHLGGNLDKFLPIVTSPAQSVATSDLSLKHALEKIRDERNTDFQSGIYISLSSPSIIENSLEVISSVLGSDLEIPVLVATDVVSKDVGKSEEREGLPAKEYLEKLKKIFPAGIPVIGWETFHGMDQVWKRIEEESLLLNFQLLRLVSVIDHLYISPLDIPQEDVRFLEILHRKIELSKPYSFTFIALEQLLKAIESNGKHALEKASKTKYKNPRLSRINVNPVSEVLSDYYVVTSSYSNEIFEEMKNLMENNSKIGFSLRAGLVTGEDSKLKGFKSFMTEENSGMFFVISQEPGDRESEGMMSDFIDIVGGQNTLIDLPAGDQDANSFHDEKTRIPQPRLSNSSKNTNLSLNYMIYFIIIILIQNIYIKIN